MAKSVKKTMVNIEYRTEVMNFRVTPNEREIIERHAEKEGCTVAQYLRFAVLMDMAFEGNVDAIKIVFSGVREGFKEALISKLEKLNVQLPKFA